MTSAPLTRRRFAQRGAVTALGAGLMASGCALSGQSASSLNSAQVVIVGGGFAGASCAKALRFLDPQLRVALVEPKTTYTACPLSNLVITQQRELGQQQFGYAQLRAAGIDVLHASATEIDSNSQSVKLASGQTLNYDRLVMAPGIELDFAQLLGYDGTVTNVIPHAWQAGEQTLLLRKQLHAMADGGLVVISVPENPYRCPPGPYERASLIAGFLQQHRPRSKLLILDSKDEFSKQALFREAWQQRFGPLLEWQGRSDGAKVVRVDAANKTLHTDFDAVPFSVANVIPPQRAGSIAVRAGLTDASGWCPIKPATFESTLVRNVHVIGDAAIANAMPKSAFAANAQARLCAAQVVANLRGLSPSASTLLNTCYSLIDLDYGISIAGVYRASERAWLEVAGAGGSSPLAASSQVRAKEAAYALDWFDVITTSTFG